MRPYLLRLTESTSEQYERSDREQGVAQAREFLRGFMRGRPSLTPAQAGEAMAGLGLACQRAGVRPSGAMLRAMRDEVARVTSHVVLVPPAAAAE